MSLIPRIRSASLFLFAIFLLHSGESFSQKTALWQTQTMLLNLMQYRPVSDNLEALAEISPKTLQQELFSDSLKTVFWINIYNSAVQLNLTDSANRANEKEFFGKKVIKVAGKELSLNDIENGMLRKSRSSKFNMHKTKWFASGFEKKLRVSVRDWRVFFALNTGVVNDPLIWFYSLEILDMELEQQIVRYCTKNNRNGVLTLSPTFKKYLNDACGISVFTQALQARKIIFKEINYKIVPGPLHIRKFPSVDNL